MLHIIPVRFCDRFSQRCLRQYRGSCDARADALLSKFSNIDMHILVIGHSIIRSLQKRR